MEGKRGRVTVTHEGRRVVVGRQQLEGMINSADTSVYITAEWRDRWREGGTERVKEMDTWLRNRQTWNKCERNTRRKKGGERAGRSEEKTDGWRVVWWQERDRGRRVWFERCGLLGRIENRYI